MRARGMQDNRMNIYKGKVIERRVLIVGKIALKLPYDCATQPPQKTPVED